MWLYFVSWNSKAIDLRAEQSWNKLLLQAYQQVQERMLYKSTDNPVHVRERLEEKWDFAEC